LVIALTSDAIVSTVIQVAYKSNGRAGCSTHHHAQSYFFHYHNFFQLGEVIAAASVIIGGAAFVWSRAAAQARASLNSSMRGTLRSRRVQRAHAPLKNLSSAFEQTSGARAAHEIAKPVPYENRAYLTQRWQVADRIEHLLPIFLCLSWSNHAPFLLTPR
jgi:hypothetical protein